MPDYSTWPEVSKSPNDLLLDTQNDRLPDDTTNRSQRDVMHELIQEEDGYELARDIAKNGWVPLELLIGIEEGTTYRILEGNRRLSALKGLLDPTLVPKSFEPRFSKLGSQNVPAEVKILVAPNRRSADRLILRKHTREQVRRWTPLMQARFYRRLVHAGEPIEDVAAEYGVTIGELRSFLRMDTLYKIAKGLDLEGAAREVVHNPRKFNASALERLLDTKNAQNFFHLTFDDHGGFATKTSPAGFRKAYSRVISDIATGTVDTRTLNRAEQVDEYLQTISEVRPNKTNTSSTSDSLLRGAAASAAPVKPKPKPARSRSVIPSDLKCQIDQERARDIFDELKRTARRLDNFLNAHAVLLRVFLEFCVYNYTTKAGLYEPLRVRLKKGPDHGPTLTQMLNELLSTAHAAKLQPLTRKLISRLCSDKDHFIHMDRLDGLVHNPSQWPSEREIKQIWKELAPLLRIVMSEPS